MIQVQWWQGHKQTGGGMMFTGPCPLAAPNQMLAPGMAATFPVTVPANTPPGAALVVQAPNGVQCQVTVPPNCPVGSQFMVEMPR